MSKHGSALSEFVFFLRFYVLFGEDISDGFFGHDPVYQEELSPDMDEEEQMWRFTLSSRLGEMTCCGNWSTTMLNTLFFPNTPVPVANVDELAHWLQQHPEASVMIRIEWSCRKVVDNEVQSDTSDFHSYLLDLPAISCSELDAKQGDAGNGIETLHRSGFLLQSSVFQYDSSVKPLSASSVGRHLSSLRQFDGQTHLSYRAFWNWYTATSRAVPLSEVRPTQFAARDPNEHAELHQLPHFDFDWEPIESEECVVRLDQFEVYAYQPESVAERFKGFLKDCFGEDKLDTELPFAKRYIKWNDVLELVRSANEATEEKMRGRLSETDEVQFVLPSEIAVFEDRD
eukprot:TRINITY_DN11018_c0_g1_i2.p1 TRINITY_DN11018_c0_g1~~TRINITY_DN11018_c0_g1_i2.p1  ORF type:complete len:386 (+),score=41.36 TRINITY_DN11018_c0_g1_i2:132-1160(+)